MNFTDLLRQIIETFHAEKIDYMLVGSVASSFYGDPRLTRDIDIVIELDPSHVRRLEKIFPPDEFYVPPEEVLRDEILNRRSFNLIHHETGLKIDFMVRKRNAHAEIEFSRRIEAEILPGLKGFIARPEDIIIKKLQFYQEGLSQKHLTDCKAILNQTEVDMAYLKEWIGKLHLEQEWNLLSNF